MLVCRVLFVLRSASRALSSAFSSVLSDSPRVFNSGNIPFLALGRAAFRWFSRVMASTGQERSVALIGSHGAGTSCFNVQFFNGVFVPNYSIASDECYRKNVESEKHRYLLMLVSGDLIHSSAVLLLAHALTARSLLPTGIPAGPSAPVGDRDRFCAVDIRRDITRQL